MVLSHRLDMSPPALVPHELSDSQSGGGGGGVDTAAPVPSRPVPSQLDSHVLSLLTRIEQIASRAFTRQSAAPAASRLSRTRCLCRTADCLSAVCRVVLYCVALRCREQSAVSSYPIAQAQSDAVELLSLLSSLPPLLESARLSHVSPAMSAACATAEQLNAALRESAAAKDSAVLTSFPRAQQLALDRLAQHNRQRQLT